MSFTESIVWTHIHGLISVLCANFPVYKPLRTKIASFFFVIQRSFGSSFHWSRAGTSQRINDSAEGLGPSFHLQPVPSEPSTGCQKRRDNYSEGAILDNYGGSSFSIADR